MAYRHRSVPTTLILLELVKTHPPPGFVVWSESMYMIAFLYQHVICGVFMTLVSGWSMSFMINSICSTEWVTSTKYYNSTRAISADFMIWRHGTTQKWLTYGIKKECKHSRGESFSANRIVARWATQRKLIRQWIKGKRQEPKLIYCTDLALSYPSAPSTQTIMSTSRALGISKCVVSIVEPIGLSHPEAEK